MDWKRFLEDWSRDAAGLTSPTPWPGAPPATEGELAECESRLGCVLPGSLRAFLRVTDGWGRSGPFIDGLAGTRQLVWLRDHPHERTWIEVWRDFADDPEVRRETDLIERSLLVSTAGDAAVLLLDPEDVDADGEWAAYFLSSWSGRGPERVDSFEALVEDLRRQDQELGGRPG